MSFHVLNKKSKLNALGLYTQEQVDELDERIKELWMQLNSAHAHMETYAVAIKNMTNKESRFSEELRMNAILESCDTLLNEAEVCLKIMHKY